MKKVLVLGMVAALATVSQAVVIDSFVNIDFDSGIVTTGNGPFKGFDAPWAPEIIGWTNYRNGAAGALNDAGVEAADVGWWLGGYGYQNAGFMSSGDAAYTMSSYTIKAGDVFDISYIAARWGWTGNGEWTVSLFYDNPANVFGSYVQAINSDWMSQHVWYNSTTGIAATPESVGGTLGILVKSTGTGIAQIDEIAVNVVNAIPEPATMALLTLGGLLLRRKK